MKTKQRNEQVAHGIHIVITIICYLGIMFSSFVEMWGFMFGMTCWLWGYRSK